MTEKNLKVEYLRAISTIGVVSIHTVYSGILYSGDNKKMFVVLFFTMIKNMLYWAVPFFGMISGFFLLDPNKEISLHKIFGKYLIRIVAVLILFGTVFSWMEIVFTQHTISIDQLPKAFLMVLKHQTWDHFWYLYALLTVYAALPLWRYIVRKSNDKILLLVLFAVYLLVITLKSRVISLHLFFLMGELFRRNSIKLNRKKAILVFLVSSVIILVLVYLCNVYKYDLNILLGYTSIFVSIQSYALFSYFYVHNLNNIDELIKPLLLCIADCSFGIYIIHMVFINIEYKVIKLHLMNNLLSVVIMIALIVFNVFASIIITMIMKKTPGLKKII